MAAWSVCPLAWSWRLSDATPEQRNKFEIIGDGEGVHWADVDEDISAKGMFQGMPAPQKAQFDQTNPNHGFVYLAREVGGAYCVKIGFTKNPFERIEPTFNPRLLEIVYVYPCYRHSESKLHDELSEFRVRGEWFVWNSVVKGAVKREKLIWLERLGKVDVIDAMNHAHERRPWVVSVKSDRTNRDMREDSCPYF